MFVRGFFFVLSRGVGGFCCCGDVAERGGERMGMDGFDGEMSWLGEGKRTGG